MTARFFRGDLVRVAGIDAADPTAIEVMAYLGRQGVVTETQDPEELVPVVFEDGDHSSFWPDELEDVTPSAQLCFPFAG